jgi:spore coat protein A
MKKNEVIIEESDVTRTDDVVKNEMNAIMRMNRRTFVKVVGATVGALALGKLNLIPNVAADTPPLVKFVDPLISIIPTLIPKNNPAYPGKDYYEIYMAQGNWQFSSQLPKPPSNSTWGYGSNYNQEANNNKNKTKGIPNNVFLGYLGPTIEAKKGKKVVVKFINNLPAAHPLQASIDPTVPDPEMYPGLVPGRATPHLHGGFTNPKFDGLPDTWFTAGGTHGSQYNTLDTSAPNEAIFEYSNDQPAANLWYHDHAMGITRLNVYAGLAGLYFIRDNKDSGKENNPLGLPAEQYEIPLVIQDKQFNSDGSLFYPIEGDNADHPIWVPEFFGDTAVVNAQTFPYLNVEPRRYRFRMVNGSQARFYGLKIEGSTTLPLWVIGMEQSLLPKAVPLQKLLLAPGERADVIVDFTGIAPGTNLIMTNDAPTPFPDGDPSNIPEIMQFRVIAPLPKSKPDRTKLPAKLVLPQITPLVATPGAPVREIVMKETTDADDNPIHVRLNEKWYNDPDFPAIDETPKVGTTEIWQFVNLTIDAHPMHMHLVQFQVVNRQKFDVDLYTRDYLAWVDTERIPANKPVLANYLDGAPLPPAPEESGWKDTAKANPGEILRVIAKFDVPKGTTLPAEYVYHCHILEHEENEMMRPMQVVP